MWVRVLAAAAALAIVPITISGLAQAPRRDAAVSGVVTDGVTGQPIAGAAVSVTAAGGRSPAERQFTDDKGRFVFTNLAAGTGYRIAASKPGYFESRYGLSRDAWGDGQAGIALAEGQWFQDAHLTMWKAAGISGTVTDEHGDPVIGVYVRALARIIVAGREALAAGPIATTDDRGWYRIGDLGPGRYVVMVPSPAASVPDTVTASALGGPSAAALAAAEAAGRPVAIRPAVDAGANTRVVLGPFPPPPLTAPGAPRLAYPAAFSGGTTSVSQAMPVELTAGGDRTGVDIRLAPVPVFAVSGVLEGPADVIAGVTLRLVADGFEDLALGGEVATTLTAVDGRFVFANIAAGTYTIELPISWSEFSVESDARAMFYGTEFPQPPGLTGLSRWGSAARSASPAATFWAGTPRNVSHWARTRIVVAGDLKSVAVTLRASATARGRIVAEIDPRFPEPSRLPTVSEFESATASPSLGKPRRVSDRSGPVDQFVVAGIGPGKYFIRTQETDWMIKSVMLGGRDHTHTPLDLSDGQSIDGLVVTFTNALPRLRGIVRDASGRVLTAAAVLAFPVEREQWTNYGFSPARIRETRSSNSGEFEFSGYSALPAGDYFVIAAPAGTGDWRTPEFLARAVAGASRVRVQWGETAVADVRAADGR